MSKIINVSSDYPEIVLRQTNVQGGILRFWYNYYNTTLYNTFINFYLIINDSLYESINEELVPFQKGTNCQSVRIGHNYEIDTLEIYCICGSNTMVKVKVLDFIII